MRLKSAMGRRGLEQYERRNAAIGGDMGALLRETAGQEFVTQFSDKLRDREMRRATLTITGGAEAEVGNVIDSVLGGGGGARGGSRLARMGRGLVKGVKGLGAGAAAVAIF